MAIKKIKLKLKKRKVGNSNTPKAMKRPKSAKSMQGMRKLRPLTALGGI